MGTAICYGGFDWPVSPNLWFGRGPQQRLVPPDAGALTVVRWSPSSIALRARLRETALVVIDQNFDPGFHSTAGIVASLDGLLAVELPAGDHEIVLTHRSQGLVAGAMFTLLGLAGAAALTWIGGRPGRR
ncbi:MAG: hypothetical protein NVS4B10_07150 [Myxococcales bacterium]